MYKKLRELELCKGSLIAIKEAMVVAWGETMPKLVYTARRAIILHVLAIEHILASRMDLIGFVSFEDA